MAAVKVPLGPAAVDITGVRAGDRNLMHVTITSKGEPVDLAGATVAAQARTTALAATALDAVVDVIDAAAGQVDVRWPGDAVTAWLAGKAKQSGVWDMQVESPASDPVTVMAGTFAAEMDVTRAAP